MTSTMTAWRVHRHGEPTEVMSLDAVDRPAPGPGEALVRVLAVAVNFPDILLSRGQYQVRPDLPFVPGIELCAEVVEVGDGVERVEVGDRVVGSHIGVLSQYATLPAALLHRAPASLDDAQAATLTVAYQTAWFGLHRRAGLAGGDALLVHAAAGGVGTAACQLGAAAGATVIGVVGSEAKVPVARAAGAEHVLLRSDDVAARVKEITGGVGADVVFDPVGGASFEASTKCVAFEGRIVVVGFASGEIPPVRANHALVKNYSVVGLHWGLYAQRDPGLVDAAHAELVRFADAGVLHPVVADVVPFDKAPEAIELLATGSTTGRLVVRVGS
ncbi:NADPH:quinone oxidoreductase family protein [Isoptericola aurantiacus]|uniref:NADPH:quinone oxidoreductase family protein n=1 Tax=Isoptericola aurantiacus TaxID=3377839 RepID=UPI00383B431D